jgi:hypothetical protein
MLAYRGWTLILEVVLVLNIEHTTQDIQDEHTWV